MTITNATLNKLLDRDPFRGAMVVLTAELAALFVVIQMAFVALTVLFSGVGASATLRFTSDDSIGEEPASLPADVSPPPDSVEESSYCHRVDEGDDGEDGEAQKPRQRWKAD
jgi:hypothetical protein